MSDPIHRLVDKKMSGETNTSPVKQVTRWDTTDRSLSPEERHSSIDKSAGSIGAQMKSSSDQDDPQEVNIRPCQLTELYEVFRMLNQVVGEISSEFSDSKGGSLAQYDSVLGKICAHYGEQQHERVEHSVSGYRTLYGNGEWILDYQTIEVTYLSESSRDFLGKSGEYEDLSMWVRPITPDGNEPLNEVVTGPSDLKGALRKLAKFPDKPALHPEDSPSLARLPITKFYDSVATEETNLGEGSGKQQEPNDSRYTYEFAFDEAEYSILEEQFGNLDELSPVERGKVVSDFVLGIQNVVE